MVHIPYQRCLPCKLLRLVRLALIPAESGEECIVVASGVYSAPVKVVSSPGKLQAATSGKLQTGQFQLNSEHPCPSCPLGPHGPVLHSTHNLAARTWTNSASPQQRGALVHFSKFEGGSGPICATSESVATVPILPGKIRKRQT